MKSVRQQIEELEVLIRELTHPKEHRWYVDMEDVVRLNREIRTYVDSLTRVEGENLREEAFLCLTLLQAFSVLTYRKDTDEEQRQHLLNRAEKVLAQLPTSLLRCRLLVSSYGELNNEDLAREAHQIIDSWGDRSLSADEQEVINTLRILESSL